MTYNESFADGTMSLDNIIDRLEKMVLFIEEVEQKGQIKQYPRLFSSYIVDKINDEINHLKNLQKFKKREEK